MFKFWKRASSKSAPAEGQDDRAVRDQKNASATGPPDSSPPAFEVVVGLLTEAGCHRQVNEDSSRYVRPLDESALARKGLLVIVADGLGEHAAGEVASRMAAEVINRVYYDDAADAASALGNAFQAANREIYDAASRDGSLRGMGTTCTTLVLRNDTALCAHVGDSRLYLVRDGEIYVLTEDHSAVMERDKRGLLARKAARHQGDKNTILHALGRRAHVEVEVWDEPLPVKTGDRFLLCSDGLYDLVSDVEIKRAVMHKPPHAACESLIALAKERGGFDNMTVAVLSIEAKAAPLPAPATSRVAGGA